MGRSTRLHGTLVAALWDLDLVVTGKWGGPFWFENRLVKR